MELLRDRSAEFEQAGVQPLGVSRDSPWTHIAWMQALDLNFPLLSDWNAEGARGFGVAHDFRGFAEVAERTAFLVDTSGTVRGAWRYETAEVPAFGEVLGWNLFLLLTYLAAGAFAYLWLRELGLPGGAALVGGLVFALAPYRVAQSAGHLRGPISALIPLALWAFERSRRGSRW